MECYLPTTVWHQQSEFVSSRQSGQIPAAEEASVVAMDKTYLIELLEI
jgi:hypothetical protein